jgi:transcriptional regulator with XRE-family HTH domain
MTLGTLIREQRLNRGLTEREVGELVIADGKTEPTSQATVNRWILGQAIPSRPYWKSLARFLGMTVAEVRELAMGEKDHRQASNLEERIGSLEAKVDRLLAAIEGLPKRR